MFDAKSILDALVNGAAPKSAAAPSGGGMGGLGDLLGGLVKGQGGAGGLDDLLRQIAPGQGSGGGSSGGGLGDILGKLGQGGGAGGGLGDILGKLGQGGGAGGGLGDILGKLGKGDGAGGGLGDILGKLGKGDGAGGGLGDILGKLGQGGSADDMMRQLKDLVSSNQLGAGAVLGGLGALVFGTETGRSIATSAAKIGALALIGGLAYRAYTNYSQGKSVQTEPGMLPAPAPDGSGFEPSAATNDAAALYVRAMIAAAAADGRIDSTEQSRILGSIDQIGLGAEAEEFLASQLNNPASAADIAADVSSPEIAVQVYTASRIAIDPDTRGETQFLDELAQRLGIDANLKAHLDAAARSAAA
ncbi:MAG: tellurite resistance TerB family protein [Hyphomicrobiaceae bacterium]|nr:tellurite resistance TerB family protein [Hyphomicrobiaceae bacterium]